MSLCAKVNLLFTLIFWAAGAILFALKSTSWEEQPADSRSFNKPCFMNYVYDAHDYWHMISALALFTTANVRQLTNYHMYLF